jgi:two-component system chemotaxis sensor kinase CheA
VLDDFVKDYLVECAEGLAQIEADLLSLERDPASKPVLASIFRVVHSIKGSSGFLGFAKMAAVAHEGEELLGKLRGGEIRTNPPIISGLLTLVDAIRARLNAIETTRGEGDRDDSTLIALLKTLQTGSAAGPEANPPASPGEPPLDHPAAAEDAGSTEKASRSRPASRPRRERKKEIQPEIAMAVTQESPPTEAPSVGALSLSESTIRVDVALLDKLMNLVGELVLTRNQILRCSTTRDEAMFQSSSQRLSSITTELQEGMMKTRMQPIRNLSSKLPRVVRDLALACGKEAMIVMEGEETELDKTLSEAIKDPLTHIIRNAVDHGIESPEVRLARGKTTCGTIRLRAFHEGGMVNLEISDDGNGIDPDRIRRKALERGWLTEEQARAWSDREVIGLIFRAGFSTAESLSMISGRGVGMDVVKSRVESIGGSVEASSQPGVGTTIKVKIPLTLTIINALIVEGRGDLFAIPQVNLVELIRLRDEALASGVFDVQGARVCRYRGKLLQLIDLNESLQIGGPADRRGGDVMNIVVLQADQQRFGLIVDRIEDAQEIVVRPLARQLKGISSLAGATIMGDGKIALILDVYGLARRHEARREGGEAWTSHAAETTPAGAADERHALVVLKGMDDAMFAIPLDDVERLETLPRSAVEWAGGRPVVAYRKTLLPLVDPAAWLAGKDWLSGEETPRNGRALRVVIHAHEGKHLGLVFDQVIDIVEESLGVRAESTRRGVTMTAVVRGRATEILDVATIRAGVELPSLAARGA